MLLTCMSVHLPVCLLTMLSLGVVKHWDVVYLSLNGYPIFTIYIAYFVTGYLYIQNIRYLYLHVLQLLLWIA